MPIRTRLAGLLFVIVAVSACIPPAVPASPTPAGQSPAAVGTARPTADPCVGAVTGLAPYLERLASGLAALRPLVLAPAFDPVATTTAVRAVSATVTSLEGTDRSLATCRLATSLRTRLESLRGAVKQPLAAALAASPTDRVAVRASAAALLVVLPDVLALSEATAGLATKPGSRRGPGGGPGRRDEADRLAAAVPHADTAADRQATCQGQGHHLHGGVFRCRHQGHDLPRDRQRPGRDHPLDQHHGTDLDLVGRSRRGAYRGAADLSVPARDLEPDRVLDRPVRLPGRADHLHDHPAGVDAAQRHSRPRP